MAYRLGPRGELEPIYGEDPNTPPKNQIDKSWTPEPGIKSEENRHCGKKNRYTVELNGEVYEVIISRSVSCESYEATIFQNERSIGSLNNLRCYTGKKKTCLEAIIDAATPSNRRTDLELAKLADLAKKTLNDPNNKKFSKA